MGVSVGGMVVVAWGDGTTSEIPVGVAVGCGGFNKLGAINKNAPNATKLARIHNIVVRLGMREDKFILRDKQYYFFWA